MLASGSTWPCGSWQRRLLPFQDVSDRLEAVETRHGPVPLTRRVQEPA
jgi:hypothetical protein